MPNSYWIDSAALPAQPKLGRDLEVDVIVVGGGITGITAAYLAKKAGKTVALIDRARCASIDTGHTTAHLTAVTDTRLKDLARRFGRDAARATWAAGIAAIDQIMTLIREEGIACDFQWVPGYLHASLRDPHSRRNEELEAEARVAAELGIRAELLESVPLFGVPGIKFSHQAIFHPTKYLAALVKTIPGGGSYVYEETNADEISDDPLTVKSGEFRIRGKFLFLATHNPLQGVTGALSAMLFQTKLALYTSYVIGGTVPKGQLPYASFWDNGDPYDYLRIEPKDDHDYIIFGGEDHKTGQLADTSKPYRLLEERLRTYVPAIQIDHRWSGQVIETTDGLPYIGETAKGQYVATGFSGNGMTFGTLGAMMAMDSLLGRNNPWADLFDISRKKLIGGAWTYIKENKDYPIQLVSDWMSAGQGDSTEQLAPGEGKILKLDGKRVAAYRDENGNVSLCSPICTHLKCIVDWNKAEKTWDCPCHGSRFEPTGKVISGPAEEPLEKLAR